MLDKLKKQQLFLICKRHEVIGQPTAPQAGDNAQNHDFLEQKPTGRNLPADQDQSRETWTGTEEMPEARWGQLRELNVPGPPTFVRVASRSSTLYSG